MNLGGLRCEWEPTLCSSSGAWTTLDPTILHSYSRSDDRRKEKVTGHLSSLAPPKILQPNGPGLIHPPHTYLPLGPVSLRAKKQMDWSMLDGVMGDGERSPWYLLTICIFSPTCRLETTDCAGG